MREWNRASLLTPTWRCLPDLHPGIFIILSLHSYSIPQQELIVRKFFASNLVVYKWFIQFFFLQIITLNFLSFYGSGKNITKNTSISRIHFAASLSRYKGSLCLKERKGKNVYSTKYINFIADISEKRTAQKL